MVSSNLTFLRGVTPSQANIVNGALQPLIKLRSANNLLPYDQKVAQQQNISTQSLASLQSLADQANQAEKLIRQAGVNLDDSQPSSTAVDLVKELLFNHRVDITALCQQFVRNRDREGFRALRAVLPWLSTAGLLSGEGYPQQRLDTASATIREFEKQLMTDAELALLSEITECNISRPYQLDNFNMISDWLKKQAWPGSLDGYSGGRIHKLFNWQGLPGSKVDAYLILSDDFSNKYSAFDAFVYTSNSVKPDVSIQRTPDSVSSPGYVAYMR